MITSAPIRFTTNVEVMRSFFELLGFTTHVVSAKGMKWVSLRGGCGDPVPARAGAGGERGLLRHRRTARGRATRLLDAGFSDAHIIDEAFGRTLAVTDPQGERMEVAERMKDPYGYRIVD